jgi:hypothetical protein
MLDLHCRQKGQNAKSNNMHISVVAGPQQDSYKQVIHNFHLKPMNNLCAICGRREDKIHCIVNNLISSGSKLSIFRIRLFERIYKI